LVFFVVVLLYSLAPGDNPLRSQKSFYYSLMIMKNPFGQKKLKHNAAKLPGRAKLCFIAFVALIVDVGSGYAQAPTISYSGPQVYKPNIAITPLAPTSNGVGPFGNYRAPVNLSAGQLSLPYALVLDATGNIYVTDFGNNQVKKIPAGGGAPTVIASGLNGPTGMVRDAAGNLYVAEAGNNDLKKIPASGGAPFIIGTGFNNPQGIAMDAAGNIFVADAGSNSILKVAAGGGTPVAVALGFNSPRGVGVDTAGNIYVADYGNNAVKKIPVAGGPQIILSPSPGQPFQYPSAIAIDQKGNLYVGEDDNVFELPATGSSYIIVSNAEAPTDGRLNVVTGMAVDNSGNTFVADHGNNVIKEFKPGGTHITIVSSGLNAPVGVAVDTAGNAYVVDRDNHLVKKFPAGGGQPVVIGTGYATPQAIATDLAGNVYVLDGDIYKIPADGGPQTTISFGKQGYPEQLALGVNGDIFVTTDFPAAVWKLTPTGASALDLGIGFNNASRIAVDGNNNIYLNSYDFTSVEEFHPNNKTPIPIASGFVFIFGIAVDAAGNVYVADYNNTVTKIQAGSGTKQIIASGFKGLFSVAVDKPGNVYVTVADQGAQSVQEVPLGGGYFINPALPPGLSLNNNTGVISGKPTALSPETVYTISAYNSVGSAHANVSIAVLKHNLNLSNLALSAGSLSPVFSPDSLNYMVTEGVGINTLYVRPTAADTTSTIEVNGVSVKSGKTRAVNLAAGVNTITIVVTSKDKTASRTYTIIAGKGSQNASLAWLSLSGSSLSPAFNPNSFNYTSLVGKAIGSITVTPRTAAITAIVKVNGASVTSGTASPPIRLNVGPNIIKVTVTAQDGLKAQSYTITVTRTPPTTITAGPVTGSITACAGDASGAGNIQQFTVSGISLNGNIIATAPTYFQVSLSAGSGYAHTVTLAQTGGMVSNQVVYVRSIATAPVGSISGNVVLSSTAAARQNLAVAGTINALPVVNPVPNQTVNNGGATAAIKFTGKGKSFTWVNDAPGIGLAPGGKGNIASFTAINKGTSVVKATITVTPEALGPHAYITSSSGNTVSVIDIATQTVIATIPVGQQPGGLAVTSDGQRVYVDNYASQSISVIGTNTNSVISTIPLGIYANAIVLSPDGNQLYVADGVANNVSVISTATNALTAKIAWGGTPGGMVISADGSKLYVINIGGYTIGANTVSVINTANNTVVSTITVGNTPVFLAISPDGSRVYVTNVEGENLSVINTATNTVIATIPVRTSPYGVSVSPDGKRVYVANGGSGNVSVINTETNRVLTTIPAIPNAFGTSVTPDGSLLYVTSHLGTVTAINTSTNSVVATIPVGANPGGLGNFISGNPGCPGAPVTFTITIKPSDASLTSMQPSAGSLSPIFTKTISSYTDTVNYTNASISITPVASDTLATITVNGVAVVSGSPSQAIPLAEGPNTISTVVTAADGVSTKTYTLTVFRPYSNDANLSFMQPTAGFMSPIFTPLITGYTDTVNYTNLAMEITPIAHDSLATIKVNGVPVVSGSMSQAISLNEGLNTITTVVTAPDGVTTKTFTITVFRAFSTDANLSQMQPSAGTMSPVFTPVITAYTDAVNNSNASITITPMVQHPLATLTVNGAALASGTTSAAIPLAVGPNTITTVVTAPDGITTKTYTLTVNRAAFSIASLNAAYQPVGVAIASTNPALADDGLLVHQGVSPNGDGVNDFLQIDNISQYPDNKLSIMNRDGQLIFEAKGYDNSSKVFDGHSNKNGQMQLPGTYFYQLDYIVKGVLKHKTGFLVLKY